MAAATAAASSASVRYAPEDPSLPKPWRGLVDGKTGYLYFWNPETNVTQYEKPVASSTVSSLPSQNTEGSSVQKDPQNQEHDDGGRNSNDDSAMVASGPRTDQASRSSSDYSLNGSNETKTTENKPIESKGTETGLSGEAYRLRHEITVTGGNVPQPFISFQATGFPSEILREVRYLLREEPNVVHYALPSFGVFLLFECSYIPFNI